MTDPETASDAVAARGPESASGSAAAHETAAVSESETVHESETVRDSETANDAPRFYGAQTFYGAETVNGSQTVNGAQTFYGSRQPAEVAEAEVEVDEFDGPVWPYGDDFTAELESGTDIPAMKLVSLSSVIAAIRRRKMTWYIAAAVGLLLGSALFVTSKPAYQVTVTILLTSDAALDPVSQMDTYALQAQSPELATIMLKKFGLNESPVDFVNSYTVTVVNNQILTIAVSNPSAAIATSRAVSLTDGFLQFRAASLRDQQSDVFAGQNQQVTQEQQTVNSLTKRVSQATSGSSSLKAQLTKATATLSALQASVASSQANQRVLTTSMISGSDVLSVSYPAILHPRKTTAIQYVGGGAIGGLVVGMAIVAIGAVMSDRPRRRSDIAEALGAPVRVSVTAGGADGGRRARRQAPWSAVEMNRVVRYVRSTLADNSRDAATLAVIAMDNAKDAALIVTDLLGTCAGEGKRVFVADLSGGVLAGQLGITTPGIHAVTVNEKRVVLTVPEPGDAAPTGPLARTTSPGAVSDGITSAYSGADIMITLAVLDPAIGGDHLSTWANEAVAVLTTGASTTEQIHATGEMIRDAGLHLTAGVLLAADKHDQSLGVVS